MPNGGSDCCGNCSHNRAVQEKDHQKTEQHIRFRKQNHCTLRDVSIRNPFWTYCRNFADAYWPGLPRRDGQLNGPIFKGGLFEGYVRIPWNDKNEPLISVPVKCSVCSRETNDGIALKHEEATLGFCTNRHYVQWWTTIHEDKYLRVENYQSPEERFKEE